MASDFKAFQWIDTIIQQTNVILSNNYNMSTAKPGYEPRPSLTSLLELLSLTILSHKPLAFLINVEIML